MIPSGQRGSIVGFHLRHSKLGQKKERCDQCSERKVDTMDQFVQASGHSTHQGIHHHIHLLFHHLHLLRHAQYADFQLGGTTSILLVSSTDGIAFLLVVPLLMVIRWGTIVVTFIPILLVVLVIQLPIILLLQLSFQLVVPLSKLFNYCGQGLHLPLQCIGRVPGLLAGVSH